MRKCAAPVFCVLLTIGAAACAKPAGAIKTQPFTPGTADTPLKSGISYMLPKRVLQVKVTYTIEQALRTHNGAPMPPTAAVARILKPIVITPVLVADPKARFVLSGDEAARSALLESNLQFSLDD